MTTISKLALSFTIIFLAGMLASGKPVKTSPLGDDEYRLVQRALTDTGGRMTQDDLTGWGLAPRQARRLAETCEIKGWLAQDPNHKNARYITPALQQIVEAVQ